LSGAGEGVEMSLDTALKSACAAWLTQGAFESSADELAACLYAGLSEEALHYVFDVTFGEAHVVANLPIGETCNDSREDSLFAIFEKAAGGLVGRQPISINRLIGHHPNDCRIDPDSAIHSEPDGLDEVTVQALQKSRHRNL
jgi:hypothetical protein